MQLEKMVTGSVDKYLNEVALDRQMYVIDNDKKVADVLSNAFASAISFSLAIRSAGTASAFTATGLNAATCR
jgi:translation elongation factor EF-Ts